MCKKQKSVTGLGIICKSPLLVDGAVEIVSGYNRRTALRVQVGGAIIRIVTALDASTRTKGLDELDVVVVVQANAALGVSQSVYTSARVILAPCIVRVQLAEPRRTDTPCDCKQVIGLAIEASRLTKWWQVEVTHVGRSVLQQIPFRLQKQRSSRSPKEVGLGLHRGTNSTSAFHRLIAI